MRHSLGLVCLGLGLLSSCTRQAIQTAPPRLPASRLTIKFSSPAFKDGAPIPPRYTCKLQNESPPLAWSNLPGGARSLAIICDDPDAPGGTWTHWLLWNLPVALHGLPAATAGQAAPGAGAIQGLNDFKHIGYGGPCPPPGPAHRYEFTLLALNSLLNLKNDVTREELLRIAGPHILAAGRFTGTAAK